jgi:hypothetical protein
MKKIILLALFLGGCYNPDDFKSPLIYDGKGNIFNRVTIIDCSNGQRVTADVCMASNNEVIVKKIEPVECSIECRQMLLNADIQAAISRINSVYIPTYYRGHYGRY